MPCWHFALTSWSKDLLELYRWWPACVAGLHEVFIQSIKFVPKACSHCPLEWARKNRGLEVPKLFRALWASAVQFTSPIHVACSVDIAWGRLALFSLNKLICVNTQKDEAQIWLKNTKKDWNLKHVGLALWAIVKIELWTSRIASWVKG